MGAATGLERAGFYGHLVPSGVPFKDSGDFVDLSLYYSEHALLFNLDNERFVDETVGDHLTTVALSEQPEARGLLIADARVCRDWMVPAYVEGAVSVDKFALASKRGGRTGLAESAGGVGVRRGCHLLGDRALQHGGYHGSHAGQEARCHAARRAAVLRR